jgi:hypothetical protein
MYVERGQHTKETAPFMDVNAVQSFSLKLTTSEECQRTMVCNFAKHYAFGNLDHFQTGQVW